MRTDDPAFLAQVTSTTTGDRLVCTIWRGADGPLELDLVGWGLDWDADRQVQGQATLMVADPDGVHSPWGPSDLVAPYGSEAHLAWECGLDSSRLPLGRWRLRHVTPSEQWRIRLGADGSVIERVPAGATIQIRADELTARVKLERLDGILGPTKSTCLAEIRHLLDDIMAVSVVPGVSDRVVPASIAYGEDRMDAIDRLLAALDAVHRMTPDGSFEVRPRTAPTVWTIDGGEGGALIDVGRELSDEGVINAATSRSQTPAGEPLVGRDVLTGGPLEYGGAFGRVPGFHQSIASTQAGVLADARSTLAGAFRRGVKVLPVECLTNVALQPHDGVVVSAPTRAGEEPLTGRVVTMRVVSAGGGETGITPAKRMQLGVAVSTEALEAVGRRVAARAR